LLLLLMCVFALHASLLRRSVPRAAGDTGPSAATSVSPAIAPALSSGEPGTQVLRQPRVSHAERAARAQRSAAHRPPKGLRAYTEEEIQSLIRAYASVLGLDPEVPLAIARCESQFRWNAANPWSSARGVFQYVAGTWARTPEGRRGTSVFDADANIRMALAHIATIGTGPWHASRTCWGA
jgi:soluble lytic murein transglycosylase-like protein